MTRQSCMAASPCGSFHFPTVSPVMNSRMISGIKEG